MHRIGVFPCVIAALGATSANADGQLNIYNWGNYTSPELIERFEKTHGVEVSLTDYDSSDTALAKIKAGAHGFDVIVVSGSYVPIYVAEGLILEARPDLMENFRHVDPEWRDPPFDPGRRFSVPWQIGTVGVSVNRTVYGGDIDTAAILFDPPEELKGRINIVPEMTDVLALAIHYVGGQACTGDLAILEKVRDLLLAAKPHWQSIDYPSLDTLIEGDVAASLIWNGASLRARLENPEIRYGYPREGYPVWSDNVAVLAAAANPDAARAFLNFMMDPENAAILSNFARYANGIAGSDEFMDDIMVSAPEIVIPEKQRAAGYISMPCAPEVMDVYARIWTEVMK